MFARTHGVSLSIICFGLFMLAYALMFFQKDSTDLWAHRIATFLFVVGGVVMLIDLLKWLATHF